MKLNLYEIWTRIKSAALGINYPNIIISLIRKIPKEWKLSILNYQGRLPAHGELFQRTFKVGRKKYCQVWKTTNGPIPILAATAKGKDNECEHDVTELLLQYVDPEGHICSQYITPIYLGGILGKSFDEVIVFFTDGRNRIFSRDQSIVINQSL
jgi:hypothetical protein